MRTLNSAASSRQDCQLYVSLLGCGMMFCWLGRLLHSSCSAVQLQISQIYRDSKSANCVFICMSQIQGLPTMVFVGVDKEKPALRTEGLLPAETIIEIIQNEMP